MHFQCFIKPINYINVINEKTINTKIKYVDINSFFINKLIEYLIA